MKGIKLIKYGIMDVYNNYERFDHMTDSAPLRIKIKNKEYLRHTRYATNTLTKTESNKVIKSLKVRGYITALRKYGKGYVPYYRSK